jgi:predicted MFS family arabinose efflux permease
LLAGRLVDRFDARFVIAGSACIGALCLASVGLLREVWHLFAFHVVFGFAHGATSLVPVTTIIARWFNVRRSLAFSIGSSGLSLGGIAIAPFVALAIERYGLAVAAPWMALGMLAGVVPMALLVLRPSPQALGLEPDGLSLQQAAEAPPQPSISYGQALRSRYFGAISIAYMFLLGAQVGAIAHLYRLVSTREGPALAAAALATMAACSTIGRLVGGGLLLKMRSRTFALGLMAIQSAGLALLAVAHGQALILIATTVFALTIGNSLMMHPLLLAERFGTREYGRIYSSSQMVTVLGVAGCPALIGVLYELSDGYQVPFLVVAAITLAGFAVLGLYTGPRASATA